MLNIYPGVYSGIFLSNFLIVIFTFSLDFGEKIVIILMMKRY